MAIPLIAALLGSSIQVGAKAPEFALRDTEGSEVRLSQLLREGPVILYFFPKAFTSG